MKKIHIYTFFIFLVLLISLSSCDQLLDVNEDPINPTEATEEQLLTGIQANFSFEVLGGIPARMAAGIVQQTSYPVAQSYDDYFITENDVDGFWNDFSYVGVMANCKLLSEQALAKNKKYHAAIAKIVWAQNMAMITDAFGNAPFSQAWQPETYPFPAYDTQEEIYFSIHNLLDEAIAHIDDPDQSAEMPGGDDFIYGGDMQKWRKYAFGLKARYYMRLSKAPGYDSLAQAQLVLDAVAQSFVSNADNAIYQYSNQLLKENPWSQYAVIDRWNTFTFPTNEYKDDVSLNNDIRLLLHTTRINPNRDAFLVGAPIGTIPDPATADPANISTNKDVFGGNQSDIGVLYGSPDSPLPWLMYSEIKFLEAEALYFLRNFTTSNFALTEAVRADLEFVRPFLNKIPKTPLDEAILSRPEVIDYMIDFTVNSYENIISNDPTNLQIGGYYATLMNQKFIVSFLSFEAYNDARRTNRPITQSDDSVLKERFGFNGMALRFPYPNSEWQYNPRNVEAQGVPLGFSSMLVPVWWDSAE